MKDKRRKSCPECGTSLMTEIRKGKVFVVCPKGDFSERLQDRKIFRKERLEKRDGFQ